MTVLVRPATAHLPDYVAALQSGWSPNNIRPEAAQEQLAQIAEDAEAFLAGLDDPQGKGPPVVLVDGSTVPRLPSFRRWIWDDGFAGSIGLRWQPGTNTCRPPRWDMWVMRLCRGAAAKGWQRALCRR